MAFDLGDFFNQYYVQPIMQHEGYNPVNTLTYALIALGFAYLFWILFKKYKISVDGQFFYSVIPFILLGSTIRVVTDSIDTGVMPGYVSGPLGFLYSFLISTHLYDYGFLTSSPGIYFVTAFLLFFFLLLSRKFGKPAIMRNAGIALWLFHFLILLPMVKYPLYPVLIVAIAGLVGSGANYFAKKHSLDQLSWLVVFSHALDGAATFVTIDLFNRLEPVCTLAGKCYGEQHVVSRFLGTFADSYLVFFALKVIFAAAVAWVVNKEAESREEMLYVFLLVVIFGLAPGVRDLLRVATGA